MIASRISLATAFLCVVALSVVGAAGAAKGKKAVPPIVSGTYLSTVTLQSPPPGVDPTFQALDTFTADGGIIVSSSQSHPTARSLAHGTCAHETGRTWACTFTWFRFDPSGAYAGMQRVRRQTTFSADRSSFTSTDTIEVLSPAGAVVATLQGSESGQRL